MAESLPRAGTKRPYSADDGQSVKRQRIHRRLRHVQLGTPNIEPAPQDPIFAQGQLLKGITAALAIVGFDSVKPSALEMFRSHTEEYLLKLLGNIRTSMQSARRTKPAASDFAVALAAMPEGRTKTASMLKPHLSLPVPDDVSCPTISPPSPPPPQAPDFTSLLAPLTDTPLPRYIPEHFPRLPPRHAWVQTPVFPERETDARKMREKATQEGMMAEQALRKLAAAAKAGALKAEKKRSMALSGPGKLRGREVKENESQHDAFADVLKDIGGLDEPDQRALQDRNDITEDAADLDMPDGVVVNYEMGHWRHGGSRRTLQL